MHETLAEIIDAYSIWPSLVICIRNVTKEQLETMATGLEEKFTFKEIPSIGELAEHEKVDYSEFPGMIYRKSWNKPNRITLDAWCDADIARICYIECSEQLKHKFKKWGKANYAHVTLHINLPYEDRTEIIEEKEVPEEQLEGTCFESATVITTDAHRPPIEYFLGLSNQICGELFSGYGFRIEGGENAELNKQLEIERQGLNKPIE